MSEPHSREAVSSVASPVRALGAVRVVGGGWLVAAGIMTLSQFGVLEPMAERLFNGDPGTTDAPIRSLLTLIAAPLLIVIGVVLMMKGFRWMRRVALPIDGPAAIARDEVIATLIRREAPAFGAGPSLPYWPLRRWLSEQLSDLAWWHRDLMGRGMRAFAWSCAFSLALGVVFFALRFLSPKDLLGPFPAAFVALLLIVTALWTALGLMLISSSGPRIESFEVPLPTRNSGVPDLAPGAIIESPPRLLDHESSALGLTLGITGVGVQCLMTSSWQLSYIGYPLMATSIVRHIGSLAGGVVFLVLGGRMVTAAAEMLRVRHYGSTIVYVGADPGEPHMGHGATLRTEIRGVSGPRHIVAAVASTNAREDAEALVGAGGR